MSKKKHPEHVNHERWLVSYADFITLLFAFFVVLFASGQNDKRKQVMLAHAVQSAFMHNGIFDQHSKTPPITTDGNSSLNLATAPIALPVPSAAESAEATEIRLKEVVKAQVEKKQLTSDAVSVRATGDGLVVSLREAGFFASGSADVRPEALAVLQTVAAALPRQSMRVEGHTDNIPIHTTQFATNWELSTARAATITRLLIAQNAVDPAQVSAAGDAEFRPIADNATDAGRAQNRRVDIILLKAAAPTTQAPPK
ncbi:flagellar motor protein MotB [Granulicella tundricola]|uniref:OmpA/MotB domain protein n=1 Tax=Granulicella tundricola (strain ATCC BAA-1859 / DSM 23138 / MP5ACTX9) TaxID=1198114 RepID=E8WW70_GRATM|nr:flagellar motor protein MotB [Granulicella tundricola]ADW68453.1 OmpA/MotB domain protein [Granulicella tundricola MP5ACTX9]